MSILLSTEQQQVVQSQEKKFTVRAAAGSGKTRVLVEKYIRHVIEQNIRPDRILTITFTKKAAAEMKKRIVDALLQNGLLEEAQIAETGPIQTIHSFCERILRENAITTGIDPQFKILSEVQVAEIYERALQNALSSTDGATHEVQQLMTHLAGKLDYNAPKTLHSKLSSAVLTVLKAFRGSGWEPTQLYPMYQNPENLIDTWQQMVLEQFPKPIAQANPPQDFQRWIGKLHDLLKENEIKLPTWLKTKPEHVHQETAIYTCGLMQLALDTWLQIDKLMEEKQAFDFAELEARAVKLIQSSDLTAERLRRQYQVILVDESQDVNPVQYRLLDALKLETEMLVGDPQQSIYGFRQADLSLFIERTQSTPCLGLNQNYRSEPGVLKFIDHFFSQLWEDSYQSMNPTMDSLNEEDIFGTTRPDTTYPGIEFWPQDRKDTTLTAHWIGQLIDEGHEPKDIAVLVRQSHYATDLGDALKDLGILYQISGGTEKFYARLEVRDLANTLIALVDPYNDFALLSMLYSPIVDLSLDTIVLLASNKPVINALSNFTSPINDDNEKIQKFMLWFSELSIYAGKIPAWEVISEIFHSSPYLQHLAARPNSTQILANVRKLLRLASEEPELAALEFATRIRNIQQIRHREGDAPALDEDANLVTIMTVHRSKGLEFPVVVMPDTHQKLNRRLKEIVCDPAKGIMFAKLIKEQAIFHEWLDAKRKQSEREEELRIAYVGMTRAKKKLCLSVHPIGNSDTLAGLISKAFKWKDSPSNDIVVRKYMR